MGPTQAGGAGQSTYEVDSAERQGNGVDRLGGASQTHGPP